MIFSSIDSLCKDVHIWPIGITDDSIVNIPALHKFVLGLSRNGGQGVYLSGDVVVMVGGATPVGREGYCASILYAGMRRKVS
ncbi:MAG TPA: hypothetical protein VJI52_03060 [Candidatus Nanoarchaeia archaeon]|nr:hypothetical protein [Candidatus Nanoarchaeia archaeon]